MKALYLANCTEYEAGWGQRPDGFMIALTLEAITAQILVENKRGIPNYYWRYDEPEEVFCDDEIYEGVAKDIAEKNFVNYSDKKKKELHLYKKL